MNRSTLSRLGGLGFWLFCSSRHTTVTVTSAISLLVGASLGEIARGDATRFSAVGIRLQAVEARASVRERLRSGGVDAKLGVVDRVTSVADAVDAFQHASPARGRQ